MPRDSSVAPRPRATAPKDVRPRIDEIDSALLRILAVDARISNKDLAERVGIAASTCLARVRALRETGVIRGFHADIDPRAIGHDVQAMIAISLQPHARGVLSEVVSSLVRRPEVQDVYFVAGGNDFLVHVACADTDELRRFVADHLNRNRAIAHTETNLIFEHARSAGQR